MSPPQADDRLQRAIAHLKRGETAAGAALIDAVLAERPADATALGLGGVVALQLGDRKTAISRLGAALKIRPDDAAAQSNIGLAYLGEGRLAEAEHHLKRALAINPDDAAALTNLGNVLRERGQRAAAEPLYRRALALRPELAEAHNNLGLVLMQLDRLAEAKASLGKALALRPQFPEALRNLGGIEDRLGHYGAAVAALERAIALNPADAAAHGELGATHLAYGKRDAAIMAFRQALALDPGSGTYQRMLGNLDAEAEAVTAQAARFAASADDRERIQLGFALGKGFEDRGDYGQAFDWYDRANRLVRSGLGYDRRESDLLFADIEAAFTPELFARLAGSGVADETPIFVLGMPRSSTTLIEQILASHPDVTGAGELSLLRELVTGMGRQPFTFAQLAAELGAGRVNRLGADYVRAARASGAATRFVTDKMPGNFLLIGMIALALPNARIIHCVREPADTGVSLWRNFFTSNLSYAYDLGEIGHYHRLYQGLMAHWHRVLPGRILDVSYEALVDDQEGETRRLLGHCGLDFRPEVLEFHKANRPVHTASAAQVRNPLNRDSIGLAARYGELLAPLHAALKGEPPDAGR